jgi:hypothetical protein
MRNLIVPIRPLLVAGAAGIHSVSVMAVPLPRANCIATPSQPLKAFVSQLPDSVSGYRLTGMRLDPILQQQWAIVSSCDHPDGPFFMIHAESLSKNIAGMQKQAASQFPIVHAGDVLRVWSYEEFFRIQTTGVAQENAALGDRLNVLLLQPGSNGFNGGPLSSTASSGTVRAVVRGPREVEIER